MGAVVVSCQVLLLALAAAAGCSAQTPETRSVRVFLATLQQARQASAAKQWSEAARLWDEVTQANPVNGDFWLRLAEARRGASDLRGAVAAYEKVRTLGVDGLRAEIPYEIARCQARLGKKAEAMKWLETAMAECYRYLDGARQEPDLEGLRADPRFRELFALVDVSRMTRDEGWRYDLALMAREIERRAYSPFRKVSRSEFERRVARLRDGIPRLSDTQVTIGLMELAALVGDGHTMVYASFERPEFFQNLPVYFEPFEEGLFITAADRRFADLLGAQVLRLGDRSVVEVFHALDPLISRDNSNAIRVMGSMRMRNVPLLAGLGLVPDPRHAVLTVRDRAGRTREVDLPADSSIPSRRLWDGFPESWQRLVDVVRGPLPLYLKDPYTDYWFEYLAAAKTVYLQWNHVADDPAEPSDAFFERIRHFVEEHPVERLVLDLRWNNGGDTGHVPGALASLIADRKIDQPGRLFVITSGYRTFSAAQNAATLIERFTPAIFVGDTTGSRPNFVGEDAPVELPYSKLQVSISDLYWQSSWPSDYREWIPPLIYVPRSFAAYAENRDPALEAILDYPSDPPRALARVPSPRSLSLEGAPPRPGPRAAPGPGR
jgi:tetratricopeptide (TPR) repeat protein